MQGSLCQGIWSSCCSAGYWLLQGPLCPAGIPLRVLRVALGWAWAPHGPLVAKSLKKCDFPGAERMHINILNPLWHHVYRQFLWSFCDILACYLPTLASRIRRSSRVKIGIQTTLAASCTNMAKTLDNHRLVDLYPATPSIWALVELLTAVDFFWEKSGDVKIFRAIPT